MSEVKRSLHYVKPDFDSDNQDPIQGLDGQLMVMAATRYCLGRSSYIVSSCVAWLTKWWDKFDENTQDVIVRDTAEELVRDVLDREDHLPPDILSLWVHFLFDVCKKLTPEQKSRIRPMLQGQPVEAVFDEVEQKAYAGQTTNLDKVLEILENRLQNSGQQQG